jgi:hypothetical protein
MGPGMRVETFDGLTLLGRRWYFRIVDAGNSEALAQGESYSSAIARDFTARRLAKALSAPLIKGKRRV